MKKENRQVVSATTRLKFLAPENCLVIEDGDFGLEAAKRAGMQSIDVRKYL